MALSVMKITGPVAVGILTGFATLVVFPEAREGRTVLFLIGFCVGTLVGRAVGFWLERRHGGGEGTSPP